MARISEALARAAEQIAAQALQQEEKPKKKTGRPPANIDAKQFEKLCGMQCTQEEIMAWFDVTDKTLTNWCKRTYGKSFSEIFRQKREKGKISLRRNQWRLSETNASVAIWLGKQFLDQHDEKDLRFQGGEVGVKIIDDIPRQKEEEKTEEKEKSGE